MLIPTCPNYVQPEDCTVLQQDNAEIVFHSSHVLILGSINYSIAGKANVFRTCEATS